MENPQEKSRAISTFAQTNNFTAAQNGGAIINQVTAHHWPKQESKQVSKNSGNTAVRKWFNRDENDGIDFIL